MIYITGDTHGDFVRYFDFVEKNKPAENDVMIVFGDAGLNYCGDDRDADRKRFVNDFPFVTFCIHGNHEMNPFDIPSYKTKMFCDGGVWYEEEYPDILFAKDGEVYQFGKLSCIVIGGAYSAYSIDKYYCLSREWNWFENEQPSDEIKEYVEKQLETRDNKIDIVLSHTCPLKYEPTEVFLAGTDQSNIDKTTEKWLDAIESQIEYNKWYCGHYHTKKTIDKIQFMFKDIAQLTC